MPSYNRNIGNYDKGSINMNPPDPQRKRKNYLLFIIVAVCAVIAIALAILFVVGYRVGSVIADKEKEKYENKRGPVKKESTIPLDTFDIENEPEGYIPALDDTIAVKK